MTEAAAREGPAGPGPPDGTPAGREIFPTSYAQRRLWFLDQWEPGSALYNVPLTLRLEGRLDVASLERSLGEIVRRHEVLRTTFESRDGEPVQVVAPPSLVPLRVVELPGGTLGERESRAFALAAQDAALPFDLGRGPLLRAALLRLDPRDHVLALTLHHIVSDAWSHGVLLGELAAHYGAFSSGDRSPLPEPPLQYADYAVWQRRCVEEGALDDRLASWKRRLQGAPAALALPTDRPRPSVQGVRGGSHPIAVPRALQVRLEARARAEGATLFMALLAAFQTLLSRFSGEDDLVVGTPVAGRSRPELEGLVGCFLNTLPLRGDLSGNPTFQELLRRTRGVCLEAYDHQDLPFERLVEALRPERHLSHTPLFQVMLVLDNVPAAPPALRDLKTSLASVGTGTSKYDLTLALAHTAEGLRGSLEYSADLFDAATAATLAARLLELLEAAAADPGRRLSDLTPLTPPRRERLEVRGYRIDPAEIEAALRAHPLVGEAVVVAREDAPGERRLVAYAVPRDSDPGADGARRLLRDLEERLPGYMLPSTAVWLEALPRAPSGDPDRARLPPPGEPSRDIPSEEPRPPTHVEERLARIWSELLRLESVGLHDNFFAAGGDSILSLQVVARAQQAGIRITPRQLFQHPTIARLAEVAESAGESGAEQGPLTGPVPLTPIQRWFFEQEIPGRHHWNQSFLLETRRPLRPDVVEEAVRRLSLHHDALRLRFHDGGDGWRQTLAAPGAPGAVESHDLSAHGAAAQDAAMAAAASRLHAGLDLERGPLLRLALFDLGPRRPGRLLIAIHHLAVDGVSWRVLLEDLELLIAQLERGETPRLPAKTTSFRAWARRLSEHARSDALRREATFWLEEEGRPQTPLPLDLAGGANLEGSARSITWTLSSEETRALLHDLPKACRAVAQEVLLTAIAFAFAPWTGRASLRIDVEGHGREDLFDGVDLSRTVGWFTSVFPLVLPLRTARGAGEALRAVKDRLRRVPRHGVGHGVLRYLGDDPEVTGRLRALPPAEVIFNYLGVLDAARREDGLFRIARQGESPARDPRGRRSHLIEIDAMVVGDRLRLRWTYGARCHRRATIERLGRRCLLELRGLIRGADAIPPAPSDFPLADLDGEELDRLLAGGGPVEDVYPLSSMQEGMLFHTLLDRGSGEYVEQLVLTLRGDLDAPRFERAWQEAIDRHDSLRIQVHWERPGRPLQVVRPGVRAPFAREDWRSLAPEDQESALERLLQEDRARGFDPARPPLLRLVLCRTADDAHRLLFSHHHLLLDGWSLAILLKEVFAGYEALRRGRLPERPPARPYADYIAWLRNQDRGASERFWSAALQGFRGATTLALGPPTGAGRSLPGRDEQEIRLTAGLTGALQDLARRQGVTLNTLVLGAWALLLARRSLSRDVVFGATVSGRPAGLRGIEDLVGLCINTLPVRVRLDPAAGLLPWLLSLQSQQAELRQHEHCSLAEIRAWSGIPPGRALFETLLVFENYPAASVFPRPESGLTIEDRRSIEWTNYPLTLGVGPGERLSICASFDRLRFDAGEIARLLDEYRGLLETVARTPARSLESLLRPDAAAGAAPVTAAAIVRSADDDTRVPIHQLISERAARTPAAPAVLCDDTRLTYADLEDRSRAVAALLRRRGVGPEAVVAILLPRSPALCCAVLGTLESGGAYLPLDAESPTGRLRRILADSRPAVVLTDRVLLPRLPAEVADRAICLDAPPAAAPPAAPAPVRVVPENLAYVIYTSGSTGAPKGVEATHDGLTSLCTTLVRRYGLGADDRVLQFASPAFDVAAEEMFPTWVAGGCVVLRTEGTPLVVPDFLAWVERCGVSVLNLPAAYWHALVDALAASSPAGAAAPALPGCLRLVVTGSDEVSADRWTRWRRFAGRGVRLLNAYGLSETAVTATLHEDTPDAPEPAGPRVPIGRPLDRVEVLVLDESLRPVPPGVEGELFIGGRGLARGYLRRPDLTAARFLPHPSPRRPGERLYRTGDRGRVLPDGVLECLGRADRQVKVRGFRVELGEIEETLRAHPSIAEAAVTPRAAPSGETTLAGYVVAAAGGALDDLDLRAWLAARLPDYMIPAAFITLAALPRTPAGKVDRSALPAADGIEATAGPRRAAAPADSADPTPEIIAGIWAEVLGRGRVDYEDDFFALGGHSLLATQIISRIRDALRVELPLRSLFEIPTVRGLAERVHAARRAAHGAPAPEPLRPRPRPERLPLSFAQERQWFLDQLAPGRPIYNIHVALSLTGRLDVPALRRSLSLLVRRHETLRTVFASVEGRPVQRVLPGRAPGLRVTDLEPLPPDAREIEVRRTSTAEARRPFDLARGPLLRARLLRLSPEEHVLLMTMHHIVSDGWSAGVSARELASLYEACAAGRAPALPDLPIQYADFALWQRDWLRGETLERALRYWRRQLAGAPPVLALPADRARPAAQSFEGATQEFPLPAALSGRIKEMSRREGVTLFMTLLAAFQTLILRYTGQDDVVLGTPIAGRMRTETEHLIGFFVNTLVLRTDLSGDPTFRELLRRTREICLQAYTHQDLPFERLVEDLAPERTLSHSPLVQAMFQLQNAATSTLELQGLTLSDLDVDSGTTQFDVSVDLLDRREGLVAQVEYSTDLFDAPTIQRLMAGYRALLEGAAEDPGRRLSELPLLAEEERRTVLEWSAARAAPTPGAALHHAFEAQARRTPRAPALTGDLGTLAYGELDERAGRLAARLRRLGVRPEAAVAVCLERSQALAIAVLGVLKAGGTYFPLDPAHPADRLAFLLADAAPRVLLTTRALRGRLPRRRGLRVVCLDDDPRREGPAPARGIGPRVLPAHPAYLIYTSGSTGRPKGVVVPHGAAVNHTAAVAEAYALEAGDRVLQFAAATFDVSIEEMFATWSRGAAVVLLAGDPPAPAELCDRIERHRLTVLNLPSSYWHDWVAELQASRARLPRSLRLVVAGSEPISSERYREWRRLAPRRVRWIGAYGATETAVTSLLYAPAIDGEIGARQELPIGRPIANVEAHVLDAGLRPVPPGACGELYLGGAGLARGYLGRPDLTAARFVPHPYGRGPGERLYRTGDRVRHRGDGHLMFLGRADDQIKLRGFRIEPGEIEAELRRHPSVREAAVVAREDERGGRRLVACVAPDFERLTARGQAEAGSERIEEWRLVHDDEAFNDAAAAADPAFNIGGWNSSYTGAPIPEAEMKEWVEGTVGRLEAFGAKRILEIGCGTGLLLLRLARRCEAYYGTDFSPAALAHVRRVLAAGPEPSRVTLLEREADDFRGLPPEPFDLVILNSVAQYFPTADYLLRVLRGILRRTRPGGRVFIGDLRSLPLLKAFHESVALHQAAASLPPAEALRLAELRLFQEEELVVDPVLFDRLRRRSAGIARFEMHLRRGRLHNEMTRFRYDVILETGRKPRRSSTPPRRDWEADGLTLESLGLCLERETPDLLWVRGAPNARLSGVTRARRLLDGPEPPASVGDLRSLLQRQPASGVDPEDVWDLGRRLGYVVDVCFSGADPDGRFDALFRRPGRECRPLAELVADLRVAEGGRATRDCASDPLRQKMTRRLVQALPAFLQKTMPSHLIPSVFVPLEKLPRTPGGKIDRALLPPPASPSGAERPAGVAPRDALELRLAQLYEEVLEIRPIGVTDGFFALGGHSLLAVRLVALVRKHLRRDLPLATLFQGDTVEKLAAALRRAPAATPWSTAVPLQPHGQGRPFFCIHPAGGGVLHYLDLARHLGAERPFYALHAPGLYGEREPLTEIDSLATEYLRAIRTVQPQGPYALGGWSFGGLMAFELASRLRADGEEVALLALLDAVAPGPDDAAQPEEDDAEVIAWYAEDFLHFFGRGLPEHRRPRLMEAEALRSLAPDDRLLYLQEVAGAVNGLPHDAGVDRLRRYVEVYRINHRAARRYTPRRPYPGAVTLFRAADGTDRGSDERALGWEPWVGGELDVRVVPGTHDTFIEEPNVPALAAQLRHCLDSALGKA